MTRFSNLFVHDQVIELVVCHHTDLCWGLWRIIAYTFHAHLVNYLLRVLYLYIIIIIYSNGRFVDYHSYGIGHLEPKLVVEILN